MATDFLIEKKLREEAPELHARIKDNNVILQGMLKRFFTYFPDFTDHSILHSLDVLDYCNRIIGTAQIEKLSPAECYVLITACYLHDIGMGVAQKDYEGFASQIDFGDYYETHSREDISATIRDFHHEFSGHYIRKYAELFEIPDGDLLYAVVQVSRGHRKTDLYDAKEYPDLETEYGILRTPYLAAVIRLADEIDVGADRNPEILFDTSKLTKQKDIIEFGTHESIQTVEVTGDAIVLHCKPKAPEFVSLVQKLNGKIQETLDYCRAVAEKRSDLRIAQTRSEVQWL